MFSYISCIYLHISNSNTTGVTCKQELLTPLEHLSSPRFLKLDSRFLSFSFMCDVL